MGVEIGARVHENISNKRSLMLDGVIYLSSQNLNVRGANGVNPPNAFSILTTPHTKLNRFKEQRHNGACLELCRDGGSYD